DVERGLDVPDRDVLRLTLERLDQIEASAQNLRGTRVLGLHARGGAHAREDEVAAGIQLALGAHNELTSSLYARQLVAELFFFGLEIPAGRLRRRNLEGQPLTDRQPVPFDPY